VVFMYESENDRRADGSASSSSREGMGGLYKELRGMRHWTRHIETNKSWKEFPGHGPEIYDLGRSRDLLSVPLTWPWL
jgi:hypothetical protein